MCHLARCRCGLSTVTLIKHGDQICSLSTQVTWLFMDWEKVLSCMWKWKASVAGHLDYRLQVPFATPQSKHALRVKASHWEHILGSQRQQRIQEGRETHSSSCEMRTMTYWLSQWLRSVNKSKVGGMKSFERNHNLKKKKKVWVQK